MEQEEIQNRLEKGTNEILAVAELVKKQLKELEERSKAWETLQKRVNDERNGANTKVVLDVGGKRFATSKGTLMKFDNSFFTAMLVGDGSMRDTDGS